MYKNSLIALAAVALMLGVLSAGAQANPIKILPDGSVSVESEAGAEVSYVTSTRGNTYRVDATILHRITRSDGSVGVFRGYAVLKYRYRPCGKERLCAKPFYARQGNWPETIPAPKVSGGAPLAPASAGVCTASAVPQPVTCVSSGGVSLSDTNTTGGTL